MKKLVEKGFDYLDLLVKPPLEELGGMLKDTVSLWRYKRQLYLLDKTQEIHLKRNIKPRKIPIKTIAKLFDEASYEEDDKLVEMWSVLLANATDSSNDIDFHYTFVKILSELSTVEAKVLNEFWTQNNDNDLGHEISFSITKIASIMANQTYQKMVPIDSPERRNATVICNSLIRLGLAEKMNLSRIKNLSYGGDSFRLTELGKLFIIECTKF